jgi:hypothetical protein
MRRHAAKLSAALAIVGLLAVGPSAALANDGLTVKYHDEGKPIVVKVNP